MRGRSLSVFLIGVLFAASSVSAAEQYLAIAGSVGVFRTDARIFNPSSTKDITIAARFHPVGGNNPTPVAKTITIQRRHMGVFDDVVSSLFQTTGLGAIALTSTDDFVSNLRIYAQGANGTNGQFVPGLDVTAAETKGVLLQLKNVGARGVSGFRTNYGLVNPNATAANITLRLYDRNNARVAEQVRTLNPFEVVGPTSVALPGLPAGTDLADGWLSYESDVKVFAYISATDNLTEDGTYVFASKDTGSSGTPIPSDRTFSITARQFAFSISPTPFRVEVGDRVTINLTSADVTHGFQLPGFVDPITYSAGEVKTVSFIVTGAPGNVTFFCTNTLCGEGHNDMHGTMVIGRGGEDDGPGYE